MKLNSLSHLVLLHFCSGSNICLQGNWIKVWLRCNWRITMRQTNHIERNLWLHRLQFRLTTKIAVASLRLNNQYKLVVTDTLFIDMIDHCWLSQARREIHLGESQPSCLLLMSVRRRMDNDMVCIWKMREKPAAVGQDELFWERGLEGEWRRGESGRCQA